MKLQDWLFSIKMRFRNLFHKKDDSSYQANEDYISAHDFSIYNRAQLEQSTTCGCFYCLKTFSPTEIVEWTDRNEDTAICPYCEIDSVIGDASGYEISAELLQKMNHYWF